MSSEEAKQHKIKKKCFFLDCSYITWLKHIHIDLASTWDNTVFFWFHYASLKAECASLGGMHKNVCFEVCVKFIWVLCSSVQTGNMIFITHHWREDSCGSQQHSWVDLDLKPKHQRKPWCELTTWTTCGTTFWAVWHWMYMLVCLDVGLQDTFLSWLLSIYEQLWTHSSHFAWEHVVMQKMFQIWVGFLLFFLVFTHF